MGVVSRAATTAVVSVALAYCAIAAFVKSNQYDRMVMEDLAMRPPSPNYETLYWHLDRLDQTSNTLNGLDKLPLQYPARGSGVTVYVIEFGCNYLHGELIGHTTLVDKDLATISVAPGFASNSEVYDSTTEEFGTAMAATVAGISLGVATEANVVCVALPSGDNKGSAFDSLAALNAIGNAMTTGDKVVVVMGLSTTQEVNLPYYDQYINAITAKGGIFISTAEDTTMASGKVADSCLFSPGFSGSSIRVAAMDQSANIFSGSSTNTAGTPCIDYLAPGVNVEAAVGAGYGVSFWYETKSGNKIASAAVAGLAALYVGELGSTSSGTQAAFKAVLDTNAGAVLYPIAQIPVSATPTYDQTAYLAACNAYYDAQTVCNIARHTAQGGYFSSTMVSATTDGLLVEGTTNTIYDNLESLSSTGSKGFVKLDCDGGVIGGFCGSSSTQPAKTCPTYTASGLDLCWPLNTRGPGVPTPVACGSPSSLGDVGPYRVQSGPNAGTYMGTWGGSNTERYTVEVLDYANLNSWIPLGYLWDEPTPTTTGNAQYDPTPFSFSYAGGNVRGHLIMDGTAFAPSTYTRACKEELLGGRCVRVWASTWPDAGTAGSCSFGDSTYAANFPYAADQQVDNCIMFYTAPTLSTGNCP